MSESVHRHGFVIGGLDLGVVLVGFGEVPFLNFIHGDAADTGGALFANDGDRAFEVLGMRQHGDVDRSECT